VYAGLSPNGKYLAITADGKTVIYEVTGLHEQTLLGYHEIPVQAFALSPDRRALACLADRPGEPYAIMSVWTLAEAFQLNHGGEAGGSERTDRRLSGITFHPEGGVLGSSRAFLENTFWLDQPFDRYRDYRRLPLPDRALLANSLCFARDGKTLWGTLYDANEVISLNWPERTVRSAWPNGTDGNRTLTCLTVGRQWVLTGSRDLTTKLLRVADGKLEQAWPSPSGPVQSVALSHDETRAASGTQNGWVQVARLPRGETIQHWQAHRDSVETVAFHPDGQLLATGSRDRRVRLWQRDGDQFHELLTLHFGNGVRQVSFSPDGTKLAVLVHNERSVRLWHLDRLRERLGQMGLGW
jgi:WD40 repeat protein